MHDVEILLMWMNSSGSLLTDQSWTTRLMVVNESTSPIARGWTVAGVQRLYVQSDSSALITEGDGSATYFEKDGSNFTSPDGDFSELLTYGAGWRRLYRDSTDVRFNSSGRMTDVYDKFNNRTIFYYDGSNQLWDIADPNGKHVYLLYGTYGLSQVYAYIYPFRNTYYTVDSNKLLTAITDPDSDTTRCAYDGSKPLGEHYQEEVFCGFVH